MSATQRPNFTKVSEYIAAGAMQTDWFLIEELPQGETEKALAFSAIKFNSYGNPYLGKAWVPKSQILELVNDFYTNDAPEKMFLCPGWLYRKNEFSTIKPS
jgi:hypothetical protein